MFKTRNTVVVTLVAGLLCSTIVTASLDYTFELPECEYDTEVQFYTAAMDVLELPEACTDGIHLSSIGYIIQDIVSDVEDEMPEYKEERFDTRVCPFPDEVGEERRSLLESSTPFPHNEKQTRNHEHRNLASPAPTPKRTRKRYRYRSTGRCKRCRRSNTDRRRQLPTSNVCAIAKSTMRLRDEVQYEVSTTNAVLESTKAKVDKHELHDDEVVSDILTQAIASYQESKARSKVTPEASDVAEKLCVSASGLRSSSTASLSVQVEMEHQAALVSKAKSSEALREIRKGLRELDALIYIRMRRKQQVIARQEDRSLQQDEICGLQEDLEDQKEETKDICSESEDLRDDIKDIARKVKTDQAWESYKNADEKVDECEDQIKVIDRAREELKDLCRTAKKEDFSSSRLQEAQSHANDANSALKKAKVFHSEIKGYHDILTGKNQKQLPANPPSASPTPYPTPSPTNRPPTPAIPTPLPTKRPTISQTSTTPEFGIEDLVLVDAVTNQDIDGAIDCAIAINRCFNGATRFNVRAKVFGNVKSVFLTSTGPIRESGRDEGIAPYAVWGDNGKGDYNRMELKPGTYTITAQATNEQGEKSPVVSKTFIVVAEETQLTNAPTSSQSESTSRTGEQEFLDRLTANLDSSNTACEKVKEAMVQKTIAEETAMQGDKVYDEVMKLAIGNEGNSDVERIKKDAEEKHSRILEEAAKACGTADLASQVCMHSQTQSQRSLAKEDEIVQKELVASAGSVLESRLALSDEKVAREEMEEVIALIGFDPVMSELQTAIKDDERILKRHKDDVEDKISQVNSQIKAMPDSAPEIAVLEKKKDSLVAEELQIEDALDNEEKFVISQSALKKDELYESVAPDFSKSPPLQYILRSKQSNNGVSVVEKNWKTEDETAGSKEEWFRRFCEKLAIEVPRRLKLQYSQSKGGCITDDAELELDMTVTELQSVWEYLDPPPCKPNLDYYSPTPPPVAVPTPAPIPGAPTTCNVDESKADECASVRENRCRDAIDYWYRETGDEEMACARVAFEGEKDCGTCLPPTMTGINLCGTSTCTADVLYTRSSAGGTCGSGILYYVMQENLSQDLACKSVAVEQSGCRPCLPPQPSPVCAETCTDAVLNTAYNGVGDTCGSGIAYWLRREPEADACARVASEQSHVCRCCHPDPSKRPRKC